MRALPTITLVPASESHVTRDTRFALYSHLLRQFIEPIYGWDESFQKQRFTIEYLEESTKIVFAGAAVAGYVVVVVKPNSHHLALLLLRPEFQRVGIGEAVMSVVVSEASTAGRPVTLSCFEANTEALSFYQRLGFSVHHEEPHFALLTNAA